MMPASLRRNRDWPDSLVDEAGARDEHQRHAALARRAHEVRRAADGADVAAAGDLAVDLALQVDFDRGVDGDESLDGDRAPRRRACTSDERRRMRGCRARSRTACGCRSAWRSRLRCTRRAHRGRPRRRRSLPNGPAGPALAPGTRSTASGRAPMPDSSTLPSATSAAAWRAIARSAAPAREPRAGAREVSTRRSKSCSREAGAPDASTAPARSPRRRPRGTPAGPGRDSRRRGRGCIRRARWAGLPGRMTTSARIWPERISAAIRE